MGPPLAGVCDELMPLEASNGGGGEGLVSPDMDALLDAVNIDGAEVDASRDMLLPPSSGKPSTTADENENIASRESARVALEVGFEENTDRSGLWLSTGVVENAVDVDEFENKDLDVDDA